MTVTKIQAPPVPQPVFVRIEIPKEHSAMLCFLLSWGLEHTDSIGDCRDFGRELLMKLRNLT